MTIQVQVEISPFLVRIELKEAGLDLDLDLDLEFGLEVKGAGK